MNRREVMAAMMMMTFGDGNGYRRILPVGILDGTAVI